MNIAFKLFVGALMTLIVTLIIIGIVIMARCLYQDIKSGKL